MFDRDKSGKIDKNELITILQGDEMENIVPKDQLMKYLEEVD